MRVGALSLEPVYDAYGVEAGRDILRIPGPADPWADCARFLDGAGNLRMTFGGFLVRKADRVALTAFESDTTLLPGLDTRPMPGYTPGGQARHPRGRPLPVRAGGHGRRPPRFPVP